MDITIFPGKLSGTVRAIPSKSQAHRLLICAAFADAPTTLFCPETNRDIEATMGCLNALGADITRTETGYRVIPAKEIPEQAELHCHDSGSTLRFLLPVAGALGVDATFVLEGRLPSRPLSPLWEEIERMGCALARPTTDSVRCTGRLRAGEYVIDGGVSSQFITGLLLSAALIPRKSRIRLTGKVESRPYITMTQRAMEIFGKETSDFVVTGGTPFHSPGTLTVEGDWSNAAFFLAAKALGSSVEVTNLSPDSPQGDRAVFDLLPALENSPVISAADIPDLVPILAVTAACKNGAVFTDIRRLRLKESDRISAMQEELKKMGARIEVDGDTVTITGVALHAPAEPLYGHNDHRIVMALAVAVYAAGLPALLRGAEAVNKSWPAFWDTLRGLGAKIDTE